MLRRIIVSVPLTTLSARVAYPCANDKKPSFKRNRSFASQFQMEKLMLSHIHELTKLNLESGSTLRDKFMNYEKMFKDFQPFKSKKDGKNDSQSQGQSESDRRKKLMELSIRFMLLLLISSYILQGSKAGDQQQQQKFSRQGSKRIVTENEMISLLSNGNYNNEIIILRQMIYSNSNRKKIYQTMCLAKENNKLEVPLTCIIINLSSFLQRLENINIPYKVNFHYTAEEPSAPLFNFNIGKIIVFGIIGYIAWKLRSGVKGMGGGISEMFNSKKFQPIKPENIQTLFKDVAGLHQAKKEITQFVDFLKNPDKYIQMGAKVPKGALLTGPPGTGKTMLARACAGQAGVPFFYVSGSQFVEKYVGLGANRVRSLFNSAAKSAPSIIFIDQIDAIGKKRNSGPFSNEEKENTLNQLLVNMDGFDSKNKIIVMAATNLKDSLDPALLRPGRFDRAVEIGLPNFEERVQILKVHLEKVKFSEEFTIEQFAKKISVLTPGFSGAELANICNQAAILAARLDKQYVELAQFEKATERVMAGLEKRNLFSDEEKQCLAYYECGKAVVSWFTQGADPIIKISITPRSKQKQGYSHEIKDEMPLKTQSELINKVICYLAGRTAEKHFKGYITSNGDGDLKKAKRILTFMVAKLGMSPVIGRIGFPDIEYMRKPYSQATQQKIDKEIDRLFKECQKRAEEMVIEKSEQIQKMKQIVIEKQTLTHNTLKQILGERPFDDNENYQKFLKDSKEEQREEESTVTPPAPQ